MREAAQNRWVLVRVFITRKRSSQSSIQFGLWREGLGFEDQKYREPRSQRKEEFGVFSN